MRTLFQLNIQKASINIAKPRTKNMNYLSIFLSIYLSILRRWIVYRIDSKLSWLWISLTNSTRLIKNLETSWNICVINWSGKSTMTVCCLFCIPVFRIRIRMDPHVFEHLDPDPQKICGSRIRIQGYQIDQNRQKSFIDMNEKNR